MGYHYFWKHPFWGFLTCIFWVMKEAMAIGGLGCWNMVWIHGDFFDERDSSERGLPTYLGVRWEGGPSNNFWWNILITDNFSCIILRGTLILESQSINQNQQLPLVLGSSRNRTGYTWNASCWTDGLFQQRLIHMISWGAQHLLKDWCPRCQKSERSLKKPELETGEVRLNGGNLHLGVNPKIWVFPPKSSIKK